MVYPCLQNTTHVTQETNVSYGQFKSLLCQYTQVLLNELPAEKVKQMEEGIDKPMPCLNRSHYGILLSGCAAEEGKQEIPPIFMNHLLQKKNSSLGKNGAVPLMQAALHNHAVRHEIQEGGDAMDPWQQLEIKLEEICNKLDLLGYNAKVVKCKVRRVNKNSLESRVPASASEEEKKRCWLNVGILLYCQFLYCWSLMLEHRHNVPNDGIHVKEERICYCFGCLQKSIGKKDIEDKAKAVLPKEKLVVADFKVLLRWQLGDEFS
jgi:hypothetical protein